MKRRKKFSINKPLIIFIIVLAIILAIIVFMTSSKKVEGINLAKMNQSEKIAWFKGASNDQKKEVLTPQQYHVLIQGNMEATFLGSLTYNNKQGNYYSAVCDYHIFSSQDKFKGNSGYLDFENINLSNVQFKQDYRTEQIGVYSICGEYLGYVEDNEGLASGKQFIINSESLVFRK